MDTSELSSLNKTWIFDLDGTLVKHNGYKNGGDELLPGVSKFFTNILEDDKVIILTARSSDFRKETEEFLLENGIKYDYILYDLPVGERVLFNDMKPSGLKTAYAYNLERDTGL
jgi:FMN phosphatase YigB (HAD superfamily)